MISIVVILAVSYLAGSIPSSIIAGKMLRGIDIREHGSGNAGATNVLRVLGWKACLAVGLVDLGKGFAAAVYLSRIAFGEVPLSHDVVQIFAGLAAVGGHIWPLFSGFRGGKGALTALGVLIGITPGTIVVCVIVFVVIVYTTGYVSLATLSAAVTLSVVIIVRKFLLMHTVGDPLFVLSLVITVLAFYTHRSNIKRLLHGTENKFKRL